MELVRVDVTTEESMMASCMALPKSGHLDQVYHIFADLKKKHNSEITVDPSEPYIDDTDFEQHDWGNSVYGEAQEAVPEMHQFPEVLGSLFVRMLTQIMLVII